MHQKRVNHPSRDTNVSVTFSENVIGKKVVDLEPTSPPFETAEAATREPTEITSSEFSDNATPQETVSMQPQAQPRYPTRECKAPQRLGFEAK